MFSIARYLSLSWARSIQSTSFQIFSTRPHRPWDPPSLLHNRYRVSFPGVKRPGRGLKHPPPSNAEVKEKVQLYLSSPSGPSWQIIVWDLLPFKYRLLYTKVFQVVSFPQVFPPKLCMHVYYLLYVPHVPPILFFLVRTPGRSRGIRNCYISFTYIRINVFILECSIITMEIATLRIRIRAVR